jgi:kynurenine formamidase
MSEVLVRLVSDLAAGRLRVVDLTHPLGPNTPVIGLPPMFSASPGVRITELCRYDSHGPAWYWNALNFGEHTGTHFDAPVHWITGRDIENNACDTIPAERFIGPACVIDVTREVEDNPDFLLSTKDVERWEAAHGRIPAGAGALTRPTSSTSAPTDRTIQALQ